MNKVDLVYQPEKPVETMDLDELTKLNAELTLVRNRVIKLQEQLNAAISDRQNDNEVRRRFERLTSDQQSRFVRYIRAKGIESLEAVNG